MVTPPTPPPPTHTHTHAHKHTRNVSSSEKILHYIKHLVVKLKVTAYPFIRLCLPHCDRVRGLFHIKDSKLLKMYQKFHGLGRETGDYKRLQNWTDRDVNPKTAGDLSLVVESVSRDRTFEDNRKWDIERRLAGKDRVSLFEMDAALGALARASDDVERRGVFQQLASRMSAVEHKWFVRLVLKVGCFSYAFFHSFTYLLVWQRPPSSLLYWLARARTHARTHSCAHALIHANAAINCRTSR